MQQETRPWGSFKVLHEEDDYKIKEIIVKPGKRLSYQSHKQRSEHWFVMNGIGMVTLGDKQNSVAPTDSVYISVLAKHRIENLGTTDLRFIEVQTGVYFGEDDIERYEDDFGRVGG